MNLWFSSSYCLEISSSKPEAISTTESTNSFIITKKQKTKKKTTRKVRLSEGLLVQRNRSVGALVFPLRRRVVKHGVVRRRVQSESIKPMCIKRGSSSTAALLLFYLPPPPRDSQQPAPAASDELMSPWQFYR